MALQLQPPSFEELAQVPASAEPSSVLQSPLFDIPQALPGLLLSWGPWQAVALVASLVAVMLAGVWLHARIRMMQLRKKEEEQFAAQPLSYATKLLFGDEQTAAVVRAAEPEEVQYQKRWEHIENYLARGTVADWRMAIIEADIMLDELLTSLGYTGGSVGEKLKQVTPEQLRSIEDAWESHKLRNKIAHEGMQAELTEREVKRAMHQYRTVFREAGLLP